MQTETTTTVELSDREVYTLRLALSTLRNLAMDAEAEAGVVFHDRRATLYAYEQLVERIAREAGA